MDESFDMSRQSGISSSRLGSSVTGYGRGKDARYAASEGGSSDNEADLELLEELDGHVGKCI